MKRNNKDSPGAVGREAEALTCEYLARQGLSVVTQNYRSPFGEIDLVAKEGRTTVFVEVRFRRNSAFGSPAETVDWRKRQKIVLTAQHYLQRNRALNQHPSRFDVVSVTMGQEGARFDWIRDAFGETV